MTAVQNQMLEDRARKHRALLHNQPIVTDLTDEDMLLSADGRIECSELILDKMLRESGIMASDEGIEEIEVVDAAGIPAHLSISTDRQVIEIPFGEAIHGR